MGTSHRPVYPVSNASINIFRTPRLKGIASLACGGSTAPSALAIRPCLYQCQRRLIATLGRKSTAPTAPTVRKEGAETLSAWHSTDRTRRAPAKAADTFIAMRDTYRKPGEMTSFIMVEEGQGRILCRWRSPAFIHQHHGRQGYIRRSR